LTALGRLGIGLASPAEFSRWPAVGSSDSRSSAPASSPCSPPPCGASGTGTS